MRPYPHYRDSGVEWLGELPEHWELTLLRRAVRLKAGEGITSEEIEEEGDYPVFGGNGTRGYTTSYTHEGEFVLIGRQGALCGNVHLARGKFWASEHAVVAAPANEISVAWLGHTLDMMRLNQYSDAAAQPGLAVDRIRSLPLPLPPLDEQRAIAAFLDRETERIDALVAKKRLLIERLEEYRTALITRTVTRGLPPEAARAAGLDPSPRLKPSGVEWLGEVPEHWEVRRISAAARPGPDSFTDGDWVELPYITDSGIRLIQTGNVGIGQYREQGYRYIDESSFDELRCTEIDPGDVLICRLADPVGRACLAPDLGVRMITSVDVCILKVSKQFSEAYLVFLLSSKRYLDYVESLVRGGTRDRISRSMLGAIKIPSPPAAEQRAIAAYLGRETSEIDRSAATIAKAVERLREYRTALITAAVTGKIDVRE